MKQLSFTTAFKRKYWQESKYVLKHIRNFNNGKDPDWSDLRKLFLIGLAQHFQGAVSPNSARLYCAYIKSLLNDYNEAVSLPCKDYKNILTLKSVGIINIYLTDNEIKKLIDYLPSGEQEHTVRNQFVLSCLTGMRHSDVIHLDSKNLIGSEIVYLSQKTRTVVRTHNCRIIEEYVSQKKNTALSDLKFNTTIREICKKVGITDNVQVVKGGKRKTGKKYEFVASHTARRSFASNLYLQTKDILLVSKLMGHSNIKTTQGYLCCDYTKDETVKSYFDQYNEI